MKINALYHTDGIWLKDANGRIALPRGCALNENYKTPAKENSVPFSGRPFDLDEADERFALIASRGFTLIRFYLTWETIEREEAGVYDEEYLAYVRALLKKAAARGLKIILSPRQDSWSAITGGCGAPAWTLNAIGADLDFLESCNPRASLDKEQTAADSRRKSAVLYYCAQTMLTLFFGGNIFAPGVKIDGQSAQDFLQERYIGAMAHAARRLKDIEAIIGMDLMNNPRAGFIGARDLSRRPAETGAITAEPAPFESMLAASGFAPRSAQSRENKTLFRDGCGCPWEKIGVWTNENGSPVLKKADFFARLNGKEISFDADFLAPFQKRLISAVQKKHSHYIFFAEGGLGEIQSAYTDLNGENQARDAQSAGGPGFSIMASFSPRNESINASDAGEYLKNKARGARRRGIPAIADVLDASFKTGAERTENGDLFERGKAFRDYFNAADSALIPVTAALYDPRDTSEWNGGASIYSANPRAAETLKRFCRPYAEYIAGTPRDTRFRADGGAAEFTLIWRPDASILEPTEIYVPAIWFFDDYGVLCEICGEDTKPCARENTEIRFEKRTEIQRLFVYAEGDFSNLYARVTISEINRAQ